MPTPLISFIVIIRQHQEVLRKCISAINNQSLQDFEVVVSDISSRNFADLFRKRLRNGPDCVKDVKTRKQISLWEQLHCAVNAASGKYIVFIDTNSWLEENAAQTLVYALENNDADVAEMNAKYSINGAFKRNRQVILSLCDISDALISGDKLRQYTRFIGDGSYINAKIYNKIYRRELLIEAFAISYPGKFGCQEILNIQYMRAARTMIFLSYVGLNINSSNNAPQWKYSSLNDAKHSYSYKLLCAQDPQCVREELQNRLRNHVKHLIQDQGWTRNATIFFLNKELSDPLWRQAGVMDSAEDLVNQADSHKTWWHIDSIRSKLFR